MKPYIVLIAAILFCPAINLNAQEKSPVKFGKVSPEDFTIKQTFDTGASAVVIADIGSSSFEGNLKGWFSIIFKRRIRIKILSKNGFDVAKVQIPVYYDGTSEEKLEDLKASTYNLENGKVIETKLESASIFKDKLTKTYAIKKFTFPAVKEGSIIEYNYTIKSDFLRYLRSWQFQSEYPCLWSEYEVGIPEYFHYVTLNQGYLPVQAKVSSYNYKFTVTVPGGADRNETVNLDAVVNTRRWVVKDIPALKEESYTSAIKNYTSGVEFQESGWQIESGTYHEIMGNWFLLGEKLMEDESFGSSLSKNNNWLDDEMKNVTKGAATKLEKARKIFAYVRDNMTCTDHSELWIETTIKDAFKKHSGSVADINLLLTAMLRHEDITADPVILSTKSNGFTNEVYPLLSRFNYVVCHIEIDNGAYDLDASSPYNGFSELPYNCYNGHARVIRKEGAMPVYFSADSLNEKKFTSVFITNDEKEGISGNYKSQLGYYESLSLRSKLKGDAAEYFKGIKSGNSFEWNVSETGIDSLKQPDMPAMVHYDFAFKPSTDESIIYFNPLLNEGYKENPFKSAERNYPVEMPYTFDETYLLNMEIPKGYTLEEVPKSVKTVFNTDEGYFEYLIQKDDESIQLRTRVKLNKTIFTPEDYNGLRDFFAFVVKKQNEQIVFKKK